MSESIHIHYTTLNYSIHYMPYHTHFIHYTAAHA
jgi:hypothetical protein